MDEHDTEFLDLSGVHDPRGQETLDAARFPILDGMSPIYLRVLNGASRVMHVSKGVEMLHEGDTPHDFYFIYSGKLDIGKHVDGKLKRVAQLNPGDVYGEFGALRKKSRYTSVFTAESSSIIRVELSTVQQIMEADSAFRERLEKLLRQRMLDSFFFSHPAFRELPANIREPMARNLPTQYVERGNRLFSQGDAPMGIHLIISGEAEVRHTKASQEETLLESRRDGDILGELTQHQGKELAYSAIATSDLDTLPINKQLLQTIREKHPATGKALEAYISQRAARTIQRLKENLG
jgi:CRP-like cAMP-binding protein